MKTPEQIRQIGSLEVNPRDVEFENQLEEEKVILLLRAHWFTNLRWVIAALFLGFLPILVTSILGYYSPAILEILPSKYQNTLLILWYMVVFGFIFEQFLMWYFNVYLVTNRRLIDVDFVGLSYKEISETEITKIQDSTYRVQGFLPTFMNYGDILVQTAGEKENIEFMNIPSPAFVHTTITSLVHRGSA